jgi:hypothetical protein
MANRRGAAAVEAVIPTTSLVASAVRYSGGKAARIYQKSADWQKECYRHYSICGEARFAANFFGHALSRAVLNVATLDAKGAQVPSTGEAATYLDDMFNGKAGQSQMLKAIGTHLTIAGECYIVGRDVQPKDVTEGEPPAEAYQLWEVVSVMEMSVVGERWKIKYGDGTKDVELGEDDVVIRIWLPHPEKRIEADSPFRSLLPILSEIEWLTRHVFAQVQSRLAGAGILFLPQSMTFPAPPEIEGQQIEMNEAEAFLRSFADALIKPIEDPSSPSAIVPFIVTAPAEAIDKAKLMHFWSNLDAESKALRQEAIHRFALGMDLPPEQVLGMSSNGGTGGGTSNGVSHWGAWQIEESTIKLFIEPMLDVVANSITVSYLRPITGDDDFIVPDTSSLRLRPDRSQEAILLYNLGVLSAKTLLIENGFSEDDLPSGEERKEWLLLKVASGSATPEQVGAALDALGVDLGPLALPEGQPRESRPDPSMEPLPLPEAPPDQSALLAASEGLVFRALERAGNRLRNDGTKPPCPSYETHTLVPVNGNADYLLTDAWSCAPQVLEGIADTEKVTAMLNAYCKTLFASQIPHNRDLLASWLVKADLS